MEEVGPIRGYIALLDRKKLGLQTCVWIRVKLKKHRADTLNTFETQMKSYEQVEQFERRQDQADAAALPRLRAFIDQMAISGLVANAIFSATPVVQRRTGSVAQSLGR